jgi:DNA-binding beta-propeller fold protein YncE
MTGASREFPAYKVYVANSGREFDGTIGRHNITIFSAGADGGLTPFSDPVPAGLGARALKFSKDGQFAYLVAADEDAVYAYAVTGTGDLAPPAKIGVGGDRPFGLAIGRDGQSLYTANIGDHTVSTFRIEDGLPFLVETVTTGQLNPRNVLVSGQFLLVSHGLPNSAGPDPLVVFPILPGNTLGPPREPIPIGGGGTGMVLTPDGRFLYIACSGTNDVYGFRVNGDGTLTPVPGERFDAPRTPESVAVTPDGSHLYVTSVASQPTPNPDEAGVWTFTIDDYGTLTAQGPRVGSGLGPGVATPDGEHLYIANFFRDTVSAFDIRQGPPREIPGSPYPAGGDNPGFDGLATRALERS